MSTNHNFKLADGPVHMCKLYEGELYDVVTLARVPMGNMDPTKFSEAYLKSFAESDMGIWCMKHLKDIEYRYRPGTKSLLDLELYGYIRPKKLTEFRLRFS